MTRATTLLSCILAALSIPAWAYGPGLNFGTGDFAAKFDCSQFPSGRADRTVEFWLRAPVGPNQNAPRQSVVELGEQSYTGSAFGFQIEIMNGVAMLGFWGHDADARLAVPLPDDDWHFVAATYSEPTLTIYVDGTVSAQRTIASSSGEHLNTRVGTCYLGGKPERGWYFAGDIGRVTIFSDVRTPDEIWADQSMSSCPKTGSGYDNLVADIAFDDQSGSSFPVTGTITGQTGGASWIQRVSSSVADPLDPFDEGVWFVIQSKEDVAGDSGIPARRQALSAASASTVTMDMIPTKGDYDKFLWKAATSGGTTRLVNKSSGTALSMASSSSNLVLTDVSSATAWTVVVANLPDWGTNAYSVAADGESLAWVNGSVRTETTASGDTGQAWMFQPMEIAVGWRLPEPEATFRSASCMFTKELETDVGMTVYATTATRSWAAMNAQLIMRNVIKAMNPSTAAKMGGTTMVIFGDHDRDFGALAQQSVNKLSPKEINEFWGSMDPITNTSHVTESMMCHKGVSYRGPDTTTGELDTHYREFEQVVHEFGHDIDWLMSPSTYDFDTQALYAADRGPELGILTYCAEPTSNDQGNPGVTVDDLVREGCETRTCIPDPDKPTETKPYTCPSIEWYPWQVQYRFNEGSHDDDCTADEIRGRTRMTPASTTFFNGVFEVANTWLPPRWLRTWQSETFELTDGDELNDGDQLRSYRGGKCDYSLTVTNGDAVVMQAGGTSTQWKASDHLTTKGSIKKVRFVGGRLQFLGINDTMLWEVDTGDPAARLIVSAPNSASPGSFLKALDASNSVVWQSLN